MNHHASATAERPGLSTPEADVVAELPLPELFKRLSTDLSKLVRDEIDLAKLELAEQAPKVGASVGLFGGAAILGLGAFFALTLTFVALLALVLPVWAAAAIVTVVYTIVAALAALRGKANLKGVTAPIPHAMRNISLDVAAMKAGFERGR